jgi:hypothetical protein
MSRLDRHVTLVQNKLALGRFVSALAWASVVYAAALWIGVLVDRLFDVRPPHMAWWLWGAGGVAVVVAMIWAIVRRPTAHEAAVFIDERLELKEKFSTALYARPLKDPFAVAAVKDAERAAENVSLHKRFPLQFPQQSLGTVGILLLVGLTMFLIQSPLNLFGKANDQAKKSELQQKQDEAKKAVERALQVVVETQAKGVADEETIKQAKKDLESMLHQPIKDADQTKRSAARALSDLDQALKQQMAKNQSIADSESDAKAFKSLMPPSDEKGPVAEAQRKIAKGDFDQAVEELTKAIDKFDKMDEAEKKKAAEQMQAMAKQLQQAAAQNPQQQQQQQQQMQQMGLNQQQAQQAQQLMQQAAQGDKQAQQQLQQMAQQAMKQMNNGQGPNQQQQQQMQQLMKQAQAQANTQAQAQQMAQAAQQMAQAMKQQQAQQGGQQGQQNAQQAGQQMAQGKQQMQQQLQAMQAMKADAQQVAAAQAAAAAAAADAAQGLNGQGKGGGQQPGQGKWQGNQNGQWKQGDNRQFKGPNNGMGGAGIGAGDRSAKEQAPYAVKEEISKSDDIEGGKILASTLIKAKSIKGESHVGSSNVSAPPEQDQTDEVEQERISRPAQQAVKEYFSAWQKDAEKK